MIKRFVNACLAQMSETAADLDRGWDCVLCVVKVIRCVLRSAASIPDLSPFVSLELTV